jgi:tyrosinase
MADFVRRDVWGLSSDGPWHPTIEAYARGVAVLQGRPDTEPTGWAYQAAIHGLPPGQAGDAWLNQCQHFSWYFLPWHRLYLYYFENIVRAAIRSLDEVDEQTKQDWALPYWNYEGGAQSLSLPPAFCEETLPDGVTANPLRVEERKPGRNDGEAVDSAEASSADARLETRFSEPAPSGGFGGAPVWNHLWDDPNRFAGSLEGTPHGTIHGAIGGSDGFMSYFETAGLDPIFWLHHSNIDRLWEVWLGEAHSTGNPQPGSPWRTFEFDFHDADGSEVKAKAEDGVGSMGRLGYTYENTDPPAPTRRGRRRRAMPTEPPESPPELVGATDAPVELTGSQAVVTFPVTRPSGPMARRGGTLPERAFLTVEGIEGESHPGINYSVWVNLPDDDDPDLDPEVFYAGLLSFFGIERTGDVETDRPGGHGLRHSFDITAVVEELDDNDRWDPEAVKVTFSPVGRGGAARRRGGAGGEPTPAVKVGRVGLYYQ